MIKLYINGQIVDLNDNTKISLNYTSQDLSQPEAIKNSYSTTFTVPSTANNNTLFNNTFLFDSNTNKYKNKLDALLTVDDTIVHKGYVVLNSIQHKQDITNYSLTFYGDVGNFFYGLMYDDEGNEKTLASLYYKLQRGNFSTYTKEEEDSETLVIFNSEWIKNSWDVLNDSTYSETTYGNITAIPTYSGLYDDFDSNKCIVSRYSNYWPTGYDTIFNTTGGTVKDGFYLVEMPREMSEFEMKELRANRQRTGMKVSKILDAISDPDNNGGYEVEWDEEFKNSKYYKDSWVIFDRIAFDDNDNYTVKYALTYNPIVIGSGGTTLNTWNSTYFTYNNSNVIDLTNVPQPQLRLHFTPVLRVDDEYKNNYTTALLGTPQSPGVLGIDITLFDENNIAEIHKMFLYSTVEEPGDFSNLGTYTTFVGSPFEVLLDEDGTYFSAVEPLEMDFRCNSKKYTIQIKTGLFSQQTANAITLITENQQWKTRVPNSRMKLANNFSTDFTSGIYEGDADGTKSTNVTKQLLLSNTPSPYKFLTDFTKMFGLRYVTDDFVKKIKIVQHNHFYQNKVVDWSDKVDMSQDYVINPALCENKWFLFQNPTPETYAQYLYSKKSSTTEYGAYKFNTKTNYNNEVEELFDDSCFETTIPYALSSIYFNRLNIPNTTTPYPPLALGDTYTTYSYSGDTEVEHKQYGYLTKNKLYTAFDPLSPKICCFDKDNGNADVKMTLCFFDGFQTVNNDWLLSDDKEVQKTLNGNYCYMLTYYSPTIGGERMGYRLNQIPKFVHNTVDYTWDYAAPKYKFTNEVGQNNIYDVYWKKWFEDQYDGNTLTCYVFLDDNNINVLFNRFYQIGKNIWVLDEINDFEVGQNKPTKCKFIKVQKITNYFD